jgi:small-conductance mechanosensitive channel
VIVAVILTAANGLTRLVAQLFAGVRSGGIHLRWLRAETAEATRRIVTVLIWVFALAVAYPYVPGSGSIAFQGISVLLGVLISLGSASLVNHAMSGLVVVYSRAFQPGDFVRVGETEGVVQELGALSTKIATPWGEITVPHGVAVSASTINYTRPVRGSGSLVSTTVTIGYDAPWRQVHALLLEAAAHTSGVRRAPEPHVLQRALSDFYVAYQLVAHVERPELSPEVLSELHQQIQDRFNAAGVQIMSPHFALQPAHPVSVPESRWFAPPATTPAREGRSS